MIKKYIYTSELTLYDFMTDKKSMTNTAGVL